MCITLKITPVDTLPFTSSACMDVYEKAGSSNEEALEHCTVNIPDSFEAFTGSDTQENIDSAAIPSFTSFDECRSYTNEQVHHTKSFSVSVEGMNKAWAVNRAIAKQQ